MQQFYDNRSLFSDYYLENRMEDHPRWQEEVSGIFQEIQSIYLEHRDHLEGMNEAQTEEEFIRPVLSLLGFTWDVQSKVRRQGQQNFPDYSLFKDEESKKHAQDHRDDPGIFYSQAIALADAKYWGRPLDEFKEDSRESYTNRNPSFQIINYLTATGLDWGIITNGAIWRLYSTKARSRVDTYFEFDLQDILDNNSAASPARAGSAELAQAFKYFYLFFRAQAFTKDPETGTSFLEQIFDSSVQYGSELQTKLKELIFDKIFIHLANGFIEHQKQTQPTAASPQRAGSGYGIESQENLDLIYEGTLRLLYRLLFVLYAEARELLPLNDEHGYLNYSLMLLKKRAAKAIDRNDTLVKTGYDFWSDLQNLFRFIDQGQSELNIPRYNGGLFRSDHPKNEFLEQYQVPDKFLIPAIELLTRDTDPETEKKVFIDYKTLNVEQLGSIYEGLLEFHLRIADEKLAVVKEKGVEVYKPAGEVKNPIRIVGAGEPYLENDKGQRKATGSYYTPDYIVQYIVENTLGPVLKERAKTFTSLMEEIREKSSGRRKQPVKLLEQQAIDTFLGIKVCDPAMGSGHFLVRATDYLAEHIIVELDKYPGNPVIRQIETIRDDIVDTLKEQDIHIDRNLLKDTNLLKRMVMKRCIYGVDLNSMATELAKLSLWLDSFTVGAPLSFLDHHLKVGNSLIGTTVEEVRKKVQEDFGGQLQAFGGPFAGMLTATKMMRGVAENTDATFSEVEESAEFYHAYENAMAKYKRVLDIWVSQHFGNKFATNFISTYGDDILDAIEDPNKAEKLGQAETIQKAAEAQQEFQFFHWDLEFPEVFIDLDRSEWKENPGFDVVVGNPPYVRQEQLKENKHFFKEMYLVYSSTADLYVYFYEIGHRILYEGGYFGMITSNKFIRAAYGKILRKFLIKDIHIQKIIDFGDLPVFPEVSAYPCILITESIKQDSESTQYFQVPSLDFESLAQIIDTDSTLLPAKALSGDQWKLMSKIRYEILQKIDKTSIPLGKFLKKIEIRRGIITGLNKAFFIDKETRNLLIEEDPVSLDLIKPLVVGDDISRYEIEFKNKYLIWTYIGVPIDNYPAIFNHLKQYQSDLEKRWDKGEHWWELRRCDYYEDFERPKIMYQDISERGAFTYDSNGLFANNTIYFFNTSDLFVLSLLNSKLLSYYYKSITTQYRGGYLRFFTQYIENTPIRKIPITNSSETRKEHTWKLRQLYTNNSDSFDSINYKFVNEVVSLDVQHDFLTYLAKQMIEMKREKQKETTGFLSWLERFMGTSLDSLSGYTIIQDYHEIPGGKEELIDRLAKNNSKIPGHDMTTRVSQEKVIEEYEKSMEVLNPLLDRIAKTDRLIDQIVYQLYGLTEEEIKIVESS